MQNTSHANTRSVVDKGTSKNGYYARLPAEGAWAGLHIGRLCKKGPGYTGQIGSKNWIANHGQGEQGRELEKCLEIQRKKPTRRNCRPRGPEVDGVYK